MNPLAVSLNEAIQSVNPHVYEMLSDLGQRLFFPKGILVQSAEAKAKAKRFNATVGTAMEDGHAMALPCVAEQLNGLNVNDALLYAPSPGMPKLREAWRAKIEHDNPSLQSVEMSLPIVTNGLSHGLSMLADVFGNPGDRLILPDMNWGNYKLNFATRRGLEVCEYSFFAGNGFNLPAFKEALETYSQGRDKVIVLLNFPNNPTGYTPTDAEGDEMAKALIALADKGVNVVAIIDDAYYGLFFEESIQHESLFAKIAGKHERLLAIKADAATKEVYVWGLRVGFVTVGVKSAQSPAPLYEALNAKFSGCIRSVISNCSALSQLIVLNALKHPDFYAQRAEKVAKMKSRAQKVHEVLANPKYADAWDVYPFNSGYFMCLNIKGIDSETLRVHLLDTYGVGTISLPPSKLRVAFSSLEVEQIPDLFEVIYKGCKDLQK